MKRSDLSKLIGASVVGLGIAVLPLSMPVSAQTDTAPGTTTAPDATTTETAPTQTTADTNTGDRDFDWGWLGLIGLAGLAGLSRKHEEPVRYRDPDPVSTTPGYRE